MKKISREEFKQDIDNYIEFASDVSLHIEHNDADLLLLNPLSAKLNVVDEVWVNEFMEIPEAHRVNPFLTCDSGDLYWGDKRNLDKLDGAIESAKKGNSTVIKSAEELKKFLEDFLKNFDGICGILWCYQIKINLMEN